MADEEINPDSSELDLTTFKNNYLPGPPSVFNCTECGGPLWERRQGNLRKYQCHLGHTLLVESLLEGQVEEIERHLWSLLRILKERATITSQMADEVREHDGSLLAAQQWEAQSQHALQRAELIRQVLLLGEVSPTSETG